MFARVRWYLLISTPVVCAVCTAVRPGPGSTRCRFGRPLRRHGGIATAVSREFIRLRLLAVLVVVPLLLAVGAAMDGGSGWWVAGAVAWLRLWGAGVPTACTTARDGGGKQGWRSPRWGPSGGIWTGTSWRRDTGRQVVAVPRPLKGAGHVVVVDLDRGGGADRLDGRRAEPARCRCRRSKLSTGGPASWRAVRWPRRGGRRAGRRWWLLAGGRLRHRGAGCLERTRRQRPSGGLLGGQQQPHSSATVGAVSVEPWTPRPQRATGTTPRM